MLIGAISIMLFILQIYLKDRQIEQKKIVTTYRLVYVICYIPLL